MTHVEIVKYMHEHGADVRLCNNQILRDAIKLNDDKMVEYLLALDVFTTEVVKEFSLNNATIQTMLENYGCHS